MKIQASPFHRYVNGVCKGTDVPLIRFYAGQYVAEGSAEGVATGKGLDQLRQSIQHRPLHNGRPLESIRVGAVL
jgi:hypothetical protein